MTEKELNSTLKSRFQNHQKFTEGVVFTNEK